MLAPIRHGTDVKLTIATGRSRKETIWKNQETTWPVFLEKISTTHRTHETIQQYSQMKKDEQDQIKDIGGFVAGILKEGRRKNGYVKQRSMLTLDADFASPTLWDDVEMLATYAIACYSTHKHTPHKPRLRLIVPLSRPVSPEEYEAIARMIADEYGMDTFDDTTYEPARLMYWPSTSKDGDYFFRYIDAPLLNPDAVLARYEDWRDSSQWPESSRMAPTRKRSADKQGDPLEKPGLIGAFCRTYSIHEAISAFLSSVYTTTDDPNRYTFVGGSTSQGLVVYDDKFAYSNHSTDPVGGQLCNAFDLVRIHKFGALDLEVEGDTPVNRLPSWTKMMELIQADESTRKTIGTESLAAVKSDFDIIAEDDPDAGEPEDPQWMAKLTPNRGAFGGYEDSYENLLIILKNDPNLRGLGRHNLFTDRVDVQRRLPWSRNTSVWSDIDDAALRIYLAKVYGIEARQKIIDATTSVFEENAYHPVRDYLKGLQWDGKPRVETVFIDYLGSTDNKYTRTVTRKTLVAAVKRIFEPGCKFDYMLTLVGDQGVGKSYIVQRLGKGWASDTITDIKGKEAYEALDGVWLMELGELAALRKAEREAIKNYISKQEDTYRKAFARNVSVNKRQCIFIGTTNEPDFLDDPTGNRRFWIVDTNLDKATRTVWDHMTESEVDQLWAEAVTLYKAGENIMQLDVDVRQTAIEIQGKHTEENTYAGTIAEFLAKPVPLDWLERTIAERSQWLALQDVSDIDPKTVQPRDRVCAAEIWVECLQRDIASLNRQASRTINEALAFLGWARDKTPSRYGPYGIQRGFIPRAKGPKTGPKIGGAF